MAEAEELCDRLALVRSGRVGGPRARFAQLRQGLHQGAHCELRVRHMLPELPRHAAPAGRRSRRRGHAAEDSSHLLRLTIERRGAGAGGNVFAKVVESGADIL